MAHSVRIDIPAELEERLRASAAKVDVNLEDFVILTLSERMTEGNDIEQAANRGEPLSQWLANWAARFPKVTRPIDDSRASIYAGRDE